MGAVMASKNLKAVAVRGKKRPSIADAKALNALARWGSANLETSDTANTAKYGTAGIVMSQDAGGGLPTHNWDSGTFAGAEPISGEVMYDTILKNRDTCYACTVKCKRVVEITEGKHQVDPRFGGPEYETIATFGSYCAVSDLSAVARANELCNQYGIDTIACGATIAWAMDCFEHELISVEDTGGLEIRFGDGDMMVRLVEMIGKGEGFGRVLGLGSRMAAQHIGRGTEDLVVAVKGNELPAHMPQVKRSLGLIYAVNPFGADHCSSEHDSAIEKGFKRYAERLAPLGLTKELKKFTLDEDKVRFALQTEYLVSTVDSINLCQFVFGGSWQLFSPQQMVEAVRYITGWEDVTFDEVLRIGERRLNLLRAFNAREGIGREQDKLPKKMMKALTGGASDGISVTEEEIEHAKDIYYEMAGWDVASGTPTRARLEELGLGWVADMLQPVA